MKKIRFLPNVPAEIRAIPQTTALDILKALHRYLDTGQGRVKRLSGEFDGLLRLRVGNHRVLFGTPSPCIECETEKKRISKTQAGTECLRPIC